MSVCVLEFVCNHCGCCLKNDHLSMQSVRSAVATCSVVNTEREGMLHMCIRLVGVCMHVQRTVSPCNACHCKKGLLLIQGGWNHCTQHPG